MEELDLRGVKCPMNFVKTRLKLDKMTAGQQLSVLLDEGEPVESVCASVQAEGHAVESSARQESYYRVVIRRN
ncbi:MAG: sulfurtransferase TusA family protein [Candidatus Obscuribacter sp.]|nr:sulfurtransferase TusA family protein [Candidatus Obscuribacter sp.]MBK9276764.1 sulfurtransferase TusA family protein [Candidatus Obscuribacter sp.]